MNQLRKMQVGSRYRIRNPPGHGMRADRRRRPRGTACENTPITWSMELAHVDVDVRVIVQRRNADTVEADSDLLDRAVVPETSDSRCRTST